ncbi:hypothetical protein ACQP00_15575 [Dactylosporangium sp. CS-047395]
MHHLATSLAGEGGTAMSDVVFVVLTVAAFALLGLAVRAVERL